MKKPDKDCLIIGILVKILEINIETFFMSRNCVLDVKKIFYKPLLKLNVKYTILRSSISKLV